MSKLQREVSNKADQFWTAKDFSDVVSIDALTETKETPPSIDELLSVFETLDIG